MITKDFTVPSTGIHTHSFKRNTEDPLLSNIIIKDWSDSTGTKSYDYLYNPKNSWEDYTVNGKGLAIKDEYANKIKCTLIMNIKFDNNYDYLEKYKEYNRYSGVSVVQFNKSTECIHYLSMCNSHGDTYYSGDYKFVTTVKINEYWKNVSVTVGEYSTTYKTVNGLIFPVLKREKVSPFCIRGSGEVIHTNTLSKFTYFYNVIFSAV